MADESLKLKWNGHIASFLEIFQSLRSKSRYTDVTLACEGRLFTVHRLVLASCSQFFDHIFEQNPSENTVIVLNEAKAQDIEALLDYMYCGQVNVQQSELSSFIKTAKCLQIKGLVSQDAEDSVNDDERILETTPGKRRKSNCSSPIPSHKTSNGAAIHSNRSIIGTLPKSSNSNLIPKCWGFQQSDLPNTTWSTSPHSKNEDGGTEKENSAPHQECLEDNRNALNKDLLTDDIHLKYAPHTQPLSKFRYSPNHPVVSSNNSPSYSSRSKDDSTRKNKFSHQSPNCSDKPVDFKREIKEEDEPNMDYKNRESAPEYDSVNYSGISEYDDSTEVIENYSHQYSDSSTPYENQPFMIPSRMTTHERSILPLKFVKKVVPMSLPSQVWRNCPTNTKSASDQDSCVTHVVGSGSNQSTVSPKLLPYAKCSNCQTNNTKLWRRSVQGEIVCNACGLYYKLHGVNRPNHLFRNAPMTRRRNPRKKKRSYEEIVDGREQQQCPEELNDSLYSESGCDSDTQEGLAMLNAALTLNSLLAKAKAQEAANKNVELHHSQTSSAVGCDSSSTTNESRPPPPPLLKISLQSIRNGASQETPASSKVVLVNHTSVSSLEPNSEITLEDQTSALDPEQQGYEDVYI